jgi:hypothetical protein
MIDDINTITNSTSRNVSIGQLFLGLEFKF